jgi:hypothetical protein
MRCETCLHAVPVISENGIHYNCALSEKDALYCLTRQEDKYVRNPMKEEASDDK